MIYDCFLKKEDVEMTDEPFESSWRYSGQILVDLELAPPTIAIDVCIQIKAARFERNDTDIQSFICG